MTREEIEELKGLAASMGLYDDKNPCKRAIILGKAIKALKQESCEDYISRQAVLDIAKSSKLNWIDNSVLLKRVSELPSVTPKQKIGRWIHNKCDKCGASRPPLFDNYCPNCGAKMEVE